MDGAEDSFRSALSTLSKQRGWHDCFQTSADPPHPFYLTLSAQLDRRAHPDIPSRNPGGGTMSVRARPRA